MKDPSKHEKKGDAIISLLLIYQGCDVVVLQQVDVSVSIPLDISGRFGSIEWTLVDVVLRRPVSCSL